LNKYLIIAFFISFQTVSQNPETSATVRANSATALKYERNSVTCILVNFPGADNMNELISAWPKMTIPEKYNNHNLPFRVMDAPYYDRYDRHANGLEIVQFLNQSHVGREVIRKWFNQQKDGTFNMDLIKERGTYNATDADLKIADAEQRGRAALEDAGESLIKRTFIVVLDFKHIEKIADYYRKRKELAAEGLMLLGQLTNNGGIQQLGKEAEVVAEINVRPGYRATVDAYIFRLNWTDDKSATFYEQVWNNPKNLDTMDVPITFIATKETVAENPGLELLPVDIYMTELANRGTEFALHATTNSVSELRTQAKIKSVRPIKAKIGLKEGLKPDQRFVMMEIGRDKYGQPTEKAIGVVRATRKISDNKGFTTGETQPSKFRQESGKAPYPGLTLVQKNDVGIGLSFGYAPITEGLIARFELKLARIFRIPQLKLYADIQFNGNLNSTYTPGTTEITKKMNAEFISIGLSKEYFMTRNVHFEPFIGYNLVKLPDFLGSYKGGLNVGLRLPINVFRWLQLVPSVSYSTVQFTKADDGVQTQTMVPIDVVLRIKF
jgi:hypothetical protein